MGVVAKGRGEEGTGPTKAGKWPGLNGDRQDTAYNSMVVEHRAEETEGVAGRLV